MGYGPWGHKESDTTEAAWHACRHAHRKVIGVNIFNENSSCFVESRMQENRSRNEIAFRKFCNNSGE